MKQMFLFSLSLASSKHSDSNQCHHEKKIYNESQTWSIDQCTTCTCRAGLVDCAMIQCPVYTHCGYMYKPENECCPKCGGNEEKKIFLIVVHCIVFV